MSEQPQFNFKDAVFHVITSGERVVIKFKNTYVAIVPAEDVDLLEQLDKEMEAEADIEEAAMSQTED